MSGYGKGKYGLGFYGGGPAPVISANYVNAVNKFTLSPIILVEMMTESSTNYFAKTECRFSDIFYYGLLISVSSVKRTIQNNLGLFEVSSVTVTISNIENGLFNYWFGSSATFKFKGVPVSLKCGEESLIRDDYINFYEGLIDNYEASNGKINLYLKDHFWTLPQTPSVGYVTEAKFSNALPAILGKPLPFCYGIHSSTEQSTASLDADARNRGAWPTLFIDRRSTRRFFLIAYHAVKSIDNVYAYTPGRGSLELIENVDYYAWPAGFIEGTRCAYIEITTTGWTDKVTDASGNLGEVTVNVHGKTDLEDGTGALLLNPVSILKDAFKFYLGDPSINTTKFNEAIAAADARAYFAAGGYVEEISTSQFLKEICDSFSIRLFPDTLGRVSIDIFEPTGPSSFVSKIYEARDVLQGSYSVDFQANVQSAEDAQIINKVDYQHKYHWAKKLFFGNDTFKDDTSIDRYAEKRLAIPMKWNSTQGGAKDVASRYVFLYRNPVPHINFKLPIKGTFLDLTDQIKFNHWEAPHAEGFVDERFEIISHQFDPESCTVDIRAIDVESITQDAFFLGDEDLYTRATGGTMGVVNGSGVITRTGGSTFVGVVQVDDIIRLKTVTNEANRKNLKVIAVAATTITVSNTAWTNESGIGYDVIPSWITATNEQKIYGHLCDETTGQFSDATEGFQLL